ncbi:MAG: methyltransferase domain-containing protein [Nanoarchaeota archaeon]|nr:methyltransferase domain-containing protein [Nanoarchaeota archaeon]
MKQIQKILISRTKKYYVRDIEADFHTELGFIRKEDLKNSKPGDILETNKKNRLYCFDPSFIDQYQKIRRGAQIISRKDLGIIIAETGISKKSIVLDSGAGSGAATCFYANLCKKVYSYELREDYYKLVKKNIEFLGQKNVSLKNKDIYQGISEKNLDMISLDLPEPWKVIPHAAKALKPGGFLVSYSPCIPQVIDFVNALTKEFIHLKTDEIIDRQWEIAERKVRPKTRQIGHTGFLSFARKIM